MECCCDKTLTGQTWTCTGLGALLVTKMPLPNQLACLAAEVAHVLRQRPPSRQSGHHLTCSCVLSFLFHPPLHQRCRSPPRAPSDRVDGLVQACAQSPTTGLRSCPTGTPELGSASAACSIWLYKLLSTRSLCLCVLYHLRQEVLLCSSIPVMFIAPINTLYPAAVGQLSGQQT